MLEVVSHLLLALAPPCGPGVPASPIPRMVAEHPCPERGTWSEHPATRWEDAMVSGNGRMGVMVFGDPEEETIVANHCRLFLPLGSREIVPDLAGLLPELREVIGDREDYRGGMDFLLAEAREQGFPGIVYTDPFHPGMFVHVRHAAAGEVRGYSRSEDFATGEVAVQWTDDRGRWSRRSFVSRADNAIVTRMRGSAKLDCELVFPPSAHRREMEAEVGSPGSAPIRSRAPAHSGSERSRITTSTPGARGAMTPQRACACGAARRRPPRAASSSGAPTRSCS